MPRYLIERIIPRAGELTKQELREIEHQSLVAQQELDSPIQWIYSAITHDRMICLYIAETKAVVREHARESGLPIKSISEVTAFIGPASDLID